MMLADQGRYLVKGVEEIMSLRVKDLLWRPSDRTFSISDSNMFHRFANC